MTAAQPTIVATCGGLVPGTWTDAEYGALILHAVALARVSGRPARVTHINTAGGDPRSIESTELEAARLAGVSACHLRFFPHPNVSDARQLLLDSDVVWVSGGSVVNLLAVWRAHGLDRLLTEAWQAGVVLAGGSAGAACWFSGCTTSSFGPSIAAVADGLALLPASLGVHFDTDPGRRPAHESAVTGATLPAGWGLDEGVGLVFEGTSLVDVVSERAGQQAYRIEASGVTTIEPRMLG